MTVSLVNFALSVFILFLGYWGYREKKSMVSLLVGIAFAIFGLSHFITLFVSPDRLINFLVVVRVFGYLFVAFALYQEMIRK
ncbi:MAG: hypothetical protein KBG67_05600 [Candidatus Atribacteria bacterium]|nr:hypothetical protein [Candidatus Atribacteria bacterium]